MSQLNNMPNFKTAQEAEAWAAAQGMTLTSKDRERISVYQRAEQERLDTLSQGTGWTDKFNSGYAKFLDALIHLGNLVQALTRTLVIAGGVSIILIFLLVVEQQRVVDGLMLFEARAHLAHFGAWAVVLVNVALEFVSHFEDERHGYTPPARYDVSLRIWGRRLLYFIGLGKWTPREKAPSTWARGLLRLVTFGILVLALGGSMRDELAAHTGDWNRALDDIVRHSTLLEMATWASGLLFALIAVLAAQGLARYVALRTSEIIAELRASAPSTAHAENTEEVAINYIVAKVAKKQAQDAAKGKDTPALVPMRQNGR